MVDQRRVRKVNDKQEQAGGPVVYVVAREQRVQDNWALLYAEERATELKVPLVVLFAMGPMFLTGSARHNYWLIESLKALELHLGQLHIPFYVETGDWAAVVTRFAQTHGAAVVVFDQNPLEPIRSWRVQAAQQLTMAVYEVDARNIVPVWTASTKEEFAAYTLRPKLHRLLPEFLTEFPKPKKQTIAYTPVVHDWEALAAFRTWSCDAGIPQGLAPGELAAGGRLRDFIAERLNGYAHGRNDPNAGQVSHLSAYLRWGNISAQRVALSVSAARGVERADKEAFLEELIVRRELAENFVYYNPHYDKVSGAHAWAQATIQEHANDPREHLYTYEELANAQTHDELWNAAQQEMVTTGKMHGYLRMYWAKKILEWTPDAQTAIDYALTLNDTYELDGRDANGVAGVMWSVCGVHDRAWSERPVFGKIRYMNYNGAKRKFDVAAYIAKHSGQSPLL